MRGTGASVVSPDFGRLGSAYSGERLLISFLFLKLIEFGGTPEESIVMCKI